MNIINDNVHQEIHMISSKSNKMQNQDLIYRKQYMQQLRSQKDQNTIMCECALRMRECALRMRERVNALMRERAL